MPVLHLDQLKSMRRSELQALAKSHDLKANSKTSDLLESLVVHLGLASTSSEAAHVASTSEKTTKQQSSISAAASSKVKTTKTVKNAASKIALDDMKRPLVSQDAAKEQDDEDDEMRIGCTPKAVKMAAGSKSSKKEGKRVAEVPAASSISSTTSPRTQATIAQLLDTVAHLQNELLSARSAIAALQTSGIDARVETAERKIDQGTSAVDALSQRVSFLESTANAIGSDDMQSSSAAAGVAIAGSATTPNINPPFASSPTLSDAPPTNSMSRAFSSPSVSPPLSSRMASTSTSTAVEQPSDAGALSIVRSMSPMKRILPSRMAEYSAPPLSSSPYNDETPVRGSRAALEQTPKSNKREREEEGDEHLGEERRHCVDDVMTQDEGQDSHLQKRRKSNVTQVEREQVHDGVEGSVADSFVKLKSAPPPTPRIASKAGPSFFASPSISSLPSTQPTMKPFSFTHRSPRKSLPLSHLPFPLVSSTPFGDASNQLDGSHDRGMIETPKERNTMYGGERNSTSRFGENGW